MAYDPENLFAKIIKGEIPCHKVYEDAHTLAFMDIFPQASGHTLIVPKSAGESIFDTEAADLAHAIATVKKIAAAMKAAWAPDGVTVMQFNGEAAGQSVFHLHFHVIPRFAGVPLGRHGEGQADAEDLKKLAGELAAKIAG